MPPVKRIWDHHPECWSGPHCRCYVSLRQLRAVDTGRGVDLLHLRCAVVGLLAIFAFLILTFVVLA